MMRFDRFTEKAQQSAQAAAEIVERYSHKQIDTEHLLLALIEQPHGAVQQILSKINVNSTLLVERLDASLRATPKTNIFGIGAVQITLTPRVKRIIDLANIEANRLKDEYISPEHLFLVILTERNTPAARILETAGLTLDGFRNAMIDIRGGKAVNEPTMRFDQFTERAQEAAQRAAEIIQRYGHNTIDTEHILLALIEQPGGVIPIILEKLNVNPEVLVERLDVTLRASPKTNIVAGSAGQIFITPRVKRMIDLAVEEANRLKDEYISTEHIFLAILTEHNTPASRILASNGLSRPSVFDTIIDLRPREEKKHFKPVESPLDLVDLSLHKESITYLDFQLKISPSKEVGRYQVQVHQSPTGEATSDFLLPFSNVEIENLILRLLRLRSTARRIDSPEMTAARKLGTALFQSVFQGQVRDVLRSSLQKVRNEKNSGLRLKLRLQDVPELANLPWEFLFDSDLQRFFAQSVQTPIVRYIELAETVLPLKTDLPLQILGVISSPSDYAELDVQKEKKSLQNALNPLIKAGFVKITWLEDSTLDTLRRTLRTQNFHILHFIGHGGLDNKTEQGVLVFTDARGKGLWIDAERLGVLLYDHRSLRLVILNACEGARNTIHDPFSSIATTLIRQGIPAVAAMQFEISDTAAIAFAADFYATLAIGFPVDAAIAEARKAIFFLPNDIEWATPVLYLRAPDGVLFEFPKKKN